MNDKIIQFQKLHDLLDMKEEAKDIKSELAKHEDNFNDAVRKRSMIISRFDSKDNDNEDHFLEQLRLIEEKIHFHREKISQLQQQQVNQREAIVILETEIKMEENGKN
ncbi:hypothetical protein WR25_23202 [Diploscapter pachys]|uniref:Uncharacterized protein n=1 Tax=Diploscapter pachys TaxID=2018661 RepID=A0A2A2K0S7_9BILA|nr:hypothetical protein WR25_23202 [Diploscapter pachys]